VECCRRRKLNGKYVARSRPRSLDNPIAANDDYFTPPPFGSTHPVTGAPENMPDYTYVTPEEVQRVCHDIGIRDWTDLKDIEVEGGGS
jgi:hypothetical protein